MGKIEGGKKGFGVLGLGKHKNKRKDNSYKVQMGVNIGNKPQKGNNMKVNNKT